MTIQAKILDEIKEIKRKQKLSVIFITHDLGVVANMADRICVMYAGKIVEVGTEAGRVPAIERIIPWQNESISSLPAR